jgi:NitT/TauT family transport system substrate-binding protein
MRLFRTAIVCAFTAVMLSGVNASGATPITVRLAVGGDSITMAPFYLAQKLGFFAAENLNVDFTVMPSAAVEIAPLSAGQLDVGGGGVTAGLYNAVARGINIKAVADMGSDPPGYGFQTLVVRNSLIASGGFKDLKDLKGRSIAITGKGTSGTAMIAVLLKKAGLTLNDVRVVVMPVPDSIVAMRNESLDAAMLPEPGPSLAVKAGVATKIIHDDAFYPNQALVVMLYGANFLNTNRDAGVRFMRAYLKAVRVYNNNLKGGKIAGKQAEDVMSVFAQATHQDRAVLNEITPCGNDPDGKMNVTSLRNDLDFFKSQGLIDDASVSVDAAIDTSFAAAAVKQLGPYRKIVP